MFKNSIRPAAAISIATAMFFTLIACEIPTSTDDGTTPSFSLGNSSSSISEKESPESSSSLKESKEKADTNCEGETGKPWNGSTAKKFACGSGSEGNPYVIKTAEQLANLSYVIGAGDEKYKGKHFKLDADIILNEGEIIDSAGIPVDSSADFLKWTPIGKSNEIPFTGHFDGNGHTISGMFVKTKGTYNGLFGYCDCTIKNLTIENSWITGDNVSGGIVGAVSGNAVLENITAKVNVFSTYEEAGGIVGIAEGTSIKIKNVKSYGKIHCQKFSGGILGLGSNVEIKDAKNYAKVTGNHGTGGIAGGLYLSATVSSTENLGEVEGSGNVGGIVGLFSETGTVKESRNSAKVTGRYAVGGIIGQGKDMSVRSVANSAEIKGSARTGGIVGDASNLKAEDVYNTGDILSAESAGGIIGMNLNGVTRNAYTTGKNISTPANFKNVGLMIGVNKNTTLADYYYIEQEVSDTTWSAILDETPVLTRDTVSVLAPDTVACCTDYPIIIQPSFEIKTSKIPAFGASDGGIALAKTSEEMKSKAFVELLGDAFVYDSNKNDGYPALKWE
ncbi:MAG: hypothetical protein IK012_11865 [Fibrobacter sp.]|uniref:hypothetical protein n=1 Tax=Fibrobacter sp. TaxID=35828 RepID=UPI0025BD0CF4|nr:hypothetical protein [Fibrobacter sp.]MBR4785928.1 hypothetical protein [Fibrobacter sp.]